MRPSHATADLYAEQMILPVQEGFYLHVCKCRSRLLTHCRWHVWCTQCLLSRLWQYSACCMCG